MDATKFRRGMTRACPSFGTSPKIIVNMPFIDGLP
jgi:hypothetical protein